MKISVLQVLILALITCTFSACSDGYQKLLRSSDYELKETKAKEYYNQGDYIKAIPLIEELIQVYRGVKDVEEMYYYYPYCYYGQGNFEFASYYFTTFIETYPKSRHVEDARFMLAMCQYEMSPIWSLDQMNSERAIEAMQLFANAHPNSERIPECNELIDEMREKMEQKAFKSARLYYDMRDYRAANVAFNNILIDYPETARDEEIRYLIIKSHFDYAKNSIFSKQEERFEETIQAYENYINKYSTSENLRELEDIYMKTLDELDDIKKREEEQKEREEKAKEKERVKEEEKSKNNKS